MGESHELAGCWNDVAINKACLLKYFGFEEKDITVLTDEPSTPSNLKPTGKNIKVGCNCGLQNVLDCKPRLAGQGRVVDTPELIAMAIVGKPMVVIFWWAMPLLVV